MIVKILGYKISLEIVILMLVIYLVMMVHALASCCNGSAIAEGFAGSKQDAENIMRRKMQEDEEAYKRIQEEARIQLEKLKREQEARIQLEKLRREEEARIKSEKIKRAIELERSHKRGKTRF